MPRKKAKPVDPVPDPATAAIIERIVQEQGYRQWKGLPVPLWADLAEAAGMGSDALSEAKNGRRKLLVHETAGIAAALGVRSGWLAFGEEPKHEPVTGSAASTIGAGSKRSEEAQHGQRQVPTEEGVAVSQSGAKKRKKKRAIPRSS